MPNFVPPNGAFHTPCAVLPSALCCFTAAASGTPPLAPALVTCGTPGGVSLDGGSTVRIESSLSSLPELESRSICPDTRPLRTSETDTARAVSATASSSFAGSKMMLSPTATTRSVIGGLDPPGVSSRGKRNVEDSQSSSKMGSSSPSDLSFGKRVERRARCVVRERSGRGYESGGDIRRIWFFFSR